MTIPLVSASVALVLATATAQSQAPAASVRWVAKPDSIVQGTSQLKGLVVEAVDTANKPIPNAPLEVVAGHSADALGGERGIVGSKLTADELGRALLSNVRLLGPDRRVWLAVRSPSGAMTTPVEVKVGDPLIDKVTLSIPSSGSVENGLPLSPAPEVKVTQNGAPIADVRVMLVVVKGDATISGNSAETDAKGIARFASLRLAAGCSEVGCNEQTLVARAGDKESAPVLIVPRRRVPTRLVVLEESGKEVVVGKTLGPGLRLRAAAADDTAIPGVTITARDLNGAVLATSVTDPLGIAAFDNIRIIGRAGQTAIILSAGGAQQVHMVSLLPGAPTSLTIVSQPPPRVVFDSAWTSTPIIQVRDTAGNAVPNVDVSATLCGRQLQENTPGRGSSRPGTSDGESTPCGDPTALLASIQGATAVRTDSLGRAVFKDLKLRGRAGEYMLRYSLAGSNTVVTSSIMRHNPRRDYDQNFVVISAIKTISGSAPKDEFFDLRFRFRLSKHAHILANTDVALSARGTDSVSSPQKRVTEASLMVNGNMFFATDYASEIPQRLIFGGAQMKVFNTTAYYGVHMGGTELGGSPFQGSLLTVGYLRRWYNDTLAVVDNDSLRIAKNNIGIDFFVRSSTIEFFKILTIRGSVLIPLGNKARPASRISIAVPIGNVYSF
jgi:hypothetical protein